MKISFSIDDGKNWISCEGIRVKAEYPIHSNDEGDEVEAELAVNFTHEGIITDVWINNTCEGTSSETYIEIGDRLVDGEVYDDK